MIREAVKGLEALGIVEARLGAGLFVQQFSFHHLFDSMVPKVIAMRAPEQVERLRGILT